VPAQRSDVIRRNRQPEGTAGPKRVSHARRAQAQIRSDCDKRGAGAGDRMHALERPLDHANDQRQGSLSERTRATEDEDLRRVGRLE
jgi:hypothetical protein